VTAAALEVPTIDLADWAEGDRGRRAAIAQEVDDACRAVGFMQVVGHGIPQPAVDALTGAMDGFFALPMDEKRRSLPPRASVNRGYTAPRSERLSHSLGLYSADDLFEAFNVGTPANAFGDLDLSLDDYAENLWPDRPAGFRTGIESWFATAGSVARTMTDVFALALDLPEGYFEAFTDHSIDTLRVNCYQAPADGRGVEPAQLGMGAHTDYGIVTVLWADPLPGLQIHGPDGTWRDVLPRSDGLLINLGDLTARWTNDRWRSTLHRVLAPLDRDGRPVRRRSAAFFHDGNADAVVSTLATCAGDHPDRYEPIRIGEHIARKLAGSRGLELNEHARHEASRLA
jgi:isopenicillin N synthase-like dioxygenase